MQCVGENCAHGWNSHVITYHSRENCEYKKTEVHKQLHVDEGNPLSEPIPSGSIRFINLPANNMKWAEDLIQRYYTTNGNEQRRHKILTREFWKGLQNSTKGPVHARFMRPTCGRVPPDSDVSRKDIKHSDFFLFIPYLHWETDSQRDKMSALVTKLSDGKTYQPSENASREELLYYQHLMDDPPLHPRRTLDQYYYSTLKDTSKRDRDQVVYRATKSHEPRIIMVDQLWLWILDGHTVFASFPRRGGKNPRDSSGINRNLRDNIPKGDSNLALDLAIAVIDQCSRVFFDRTQPEDNRPEMMEMFADEIGAITDKLTTAYDEFWQLIEEDSSTHQDFLDIILQKLETHPARGAPFTVNHVVPSNLETLLQPIYERATDQEIRKRIRRQKLLDINPEGHLSRSIKDVLDELNMIRKVYREQETVLEEFADLLNSEMVQYGNGGNQLLTLDMTKSKAGDLVNRIKKRIAEIDMLIDRAEHTSLGLKELLDLKQMQANVSEARESHELAREARLQTVQAIKQNRALFLFTVVTIVFLPLGFFASVFGMNTLENGQGKMSIGTQFAIMFPASLAIITLSFTLAFSAGVSFLCIMAVRIGWACFLRGTGILHLWNRWGIKERDWRAIERREEGLLKRIYGERKPSKYHHV